MKKIALAALLAITTLLPAAGYAQVYVRVGPLLRSWRGGHSRPSAAMSGWAGINAGTARVTYGFLVAGIVRHAVMQGGCLITGCIAAADGCWWKDTGVKVGICREKRGGARLAFLLPQWSFTSADLLLVTN